MIFEKQTVPGFILIKSTYCSGETYVMGNQIEINLSSSFRDKIHLGLEFELIRQDVC